MKRRAVALSAALSAALLLPGCSDLTESTTPNQVDEPGPGVTQTPIPLDDSRTPFVLESEDTVGG